MRGLQGEKAAVGAVGGGVSEKRTVVVVVVLGELQNHRHESSMCMQCQLVEHASSRGRCRIKGRMRYQGCM